MLLRYKVQSVNAFYENHRCLFREYYETINTLSGQQPDFLFNVQQLVKLSVGDGCSLLWVIRSGKWYLLVSGLPIGPIVMGQGDDKNMGQTDCPKSQIYAV